MSWSYRVVKTEDHQYGIREIYWKDSAKKIPAKELTYCHVCYWSAHAMYPYGETLEELIEDMEMIHNAINLPVLEESIMYKTTRKLYGR